VRLRRALCVAIVLLTAFASETFSAAIDGIGADGWHTWRVEAGENAADWCCYVWNSGNAERTGCDLDGSRSGYSSSDDRSSLAPHIQIYTLMSNGNVLKIRTLSSQCPVTTRTEIFDLGIVENDDSVGWLAQYVAPRSELSSDALAAMSAHENSFDAIVSVIEDRELDEDIRRQALFWLVESKSEQGFEYIERLLVGT